MHKKNLVTAYDVIKRIMIVHPDTQENDIRLFLYVMDYYKVSRNTPLKEFFFNDAFKSRGLPTYKTVTRTRCKLQHDMPNLFPKTKQRHRLLNTLTTKDITTGELKQEPIMKIVENILRTKPKSRENDFLLYAYVLNWCGILAKEVSINDICDSIDKGNYPMFTTIDACRRQLQSLYPGELEASREITLERTKLIDDYKQFNKMNDDDFVKI